jgi:hypothetical protein
VGREDGDEGGDPLADDFFARSSAARFMPGVRDLGTVFDAVFRSSTWPAVAQARDDPSTRRSEVWLATSHRHRH